MLLRYRICGNEKESRDYGNWSIDSTMINHCPVCDRVTNHTVVGRIAEMVDYEKYRSRILRSHTDITG